MIAQGAHASIVLYPDDDRVIVELIVDNGKTEFNGVKTPTCLAIGPAEDVDLEPVTGHLKLL